MNQKRNSKKSKQSSAFEVAEEMRFTTYAISSLIESFVLTVWNAFPSSTPPRAQKQIQQAALRIKELDTLVSQLSLFLASERKLSRLKNRSDKRSSVVPGTRIAKKRNN